MRPEHEPWAEWEEEFLREVYPLPEWSAKGIGEKLDRTEKAIFQKVCALKITQPKDRLDRQAIKELINQGMNANQIAKRLGYTGSAVRYAIKAMARKGVA